MTLLSKLNLRIVLIALILIWVASFPVKGIFFQLSLYLLPVLVLTFRQTRLLLRHNSSVILLLSLCFSLPLLLSDLWFLFFHGGSLNSDPFEIFWRLALFPVVLVAACDYSHFTIRWLQNSFVLFAAIYGIIGTVALLIHSSLGGRTFDWRAVGIVSNPNTFGFLMIVAVLICIHRLFFSVSKMELFIFSSGFLLLLIAGFLSGSRSALLGGVLSIALLLILQREGFVAVFVDKKKLLLLSGMIMSLFILSWLLWHSHLSDFFARIVSAFNGDIRLQIWQHYLGLVKNPILGGGVDDADRFFFLGRRFGPHNMYLSVFVHSGIVGLSGLLLGLVWLLKLIMSSSCSDRPLHFALLLLLCTFCFFNAPLFGNEMTQGVFALIVTMIVSGDSSDRENFPPLF